MNRIILLLKNSLGKVKLETEYLIDEIRTRESMISPDKSTLEIDSLKLYLAFNEMRCRVLEALINTF